jgi:tetratricopeptide (TPR) repeat protein
VTRTSGRGRAAEYSATGRGGILVAALSLCLAPSVSGQGVADLMAEGDAHYERRGEGARGGTADPRQTDLAIAAYRKALAAAPRDRHALSRLLRAFNFRGAFCGADIESQKRIFEEGKALGQAEVDRLEEAVKGRSPAERIAALRAMDGAAGAYYWTAAHWGQWALARGKFAAARAGVAGRVRDLAETVVAIDPALEEGGGYRILGRLHDQSPRIPFITGWVSKDKALDYLRKSYALGPTNPVTWFFLGEAILDHEPRNAEEGRRLLRRCVETPPRADYYVESVQYAEYARAGLEAAK